MPRQKEVLKNMKYSSLLLFCFAITVSCTQNDIQPQTDVNAKFLPPDKKILIFIGQEPEDIGGNIYPIESFSASHVDPNDPHGYGYVEKMVEQGGAPMPGGITSYYFLSIKNNQPALTGNFEYLEDLTKAEKFDNTTFHISLGIADVNQAIADGYFDKAIKELGEKIASYQRPVFLRIGYEFDNVGHGNPNPEIFKKAWRRIVDVLNEQKITNYATVFSSIFLFESVPLVTNCSSNNPLDCFPHEAYYPGDGYVDWMGASFWFGPGLLLDAKCLAMLTFAKKQGKPVMLSETAPMFTDFKITRNEVLFMARFMQFFNFLEKNREQIRAVHYINDHWQINPFWGTQPIYQIFANMDTRLHVHPKVKSLWLEKMLQTDIYLNAHEGLFQELGYTR